MSSMLSNGQPQADIVQLLPVVISLIQWLKYNILWRGNPSLLKLFKSFHCIKYTDAVVHCVIRTINNRNNIFITK